MMCNTFSYPYLLIAGLVVFSLSFLSCHQKASNDKPSKTENSGTPDIAESPENTPAQTKTVEKITILGDYVRVRDKPTTKGSEIKFRLSKNDECDLLEQGPESSEGGVTDFWYKIDCEGKTGWVFGGLTSKKAGADDGSEPEDWFQYDSELVKNIDLVLKMTKSLTDLYQNCPKDPACKITEEQVKNAFDLENTVLIATATFKTSKILYVEDGTWPFDAEIEDGEIILGPGIKVGMPKGELEKMVGKTIEKDYLNIQGENDDFILRIKDGKVAKIKYAGYTG